jgi:hypothetical protein
MKPDGSELTDDEGDRLDGFIQRVKQQLRSGRTDGEVLPPSLGLGLQLVGPNLRPDQWRLFVHDTEGARRARCGFTFSVQEVLAPSAQYLALADLAAGLLRAGLEEEP